MTRTTDMTVGNPTKHILKFAFPLILTNIGQQLYMIADASIVGRGVGVKALAFRRELIRFHFLCDFWNRQSMRRISAFFENTHEIHEFELFAICTHLPQQPFTTLNNFE